ncbi:hypothetical protein CONLIGDRAFT_684642 [Coniochaeta ligniaria NRRL 30616]|uniref:Uncharacterized protein n=1 Tax=Coniochaeta ligniaria NRRL 30616 TaxID=1408157 RepID=A0A1J7J8J0_9PEZI|nr:hypothetical protein CONLIGDRAFT_684642 [Coniochaeta ligniaria NRRL 30616]
MSVLLEELPHLWQKPAFEELQDCLNRLEVKPPVWGSNVSRAHVLKQQNAALKDRREITQFLSSVTSSSLAWIDNDDQREELWTVASRRLAERCGRTAMGEITRSFHFVHEDGSTFDLTIREPPITGESLGLKTWGSSYVLAKLLPWFAKDSLSHVLGEMQGPEAQVLELGSGTGLLGLAAACFWRAPVILTDLPTITPNLAHNVDINRSIAEAFEGSVDTAPLTWGDHDQTDERFHTPHQYQLIIVADPLYDDDHPSLLAGTIHEQLSLSSNARVLVMVPLRDETTRKLKSTFQKQLLQQRQPLVCTGESMATGQDDWGEDDEGQEVNCWWAIFKRQDPATEDKAPA